MREVGRRVVGLGSYLFGLFDFLGFDFKFFFDRWLLDRLGRGFLDRMYGGGGGGRNRNYGSSLANRLRFGAFGEFGVLGALRA